jgi:hypothetical protein
VPPAKPAPVKSQYGGAGAIITSVTTPEPHVFSPSSLKREAIATGTTVVRGKRCTLNDGIVYAGQLRLQQAAA